MLNNMVWVNRKLFMVILFCALDRVIDLQQFFYVILAVFAVTTTATTVYYLARKTA